MDFPSAIKTCLSKYATFEGRASRSELWWFSLFTFIIGMAAAVISDKLNLAINILLFLPTLAVTVRRLHDRNKSGWFLLLHLVLIIGSIILLVWYCQRGTIGTNRFGPDPLQTSW